ncbi:MAG TPA: LuxR C-terminal-related transcriptional regulator [Dysgonamonadaceae bacterium]|jgi:DNA-binding NarL/FixJ family response regulator|nr:LuxR C-terminal-related transcriptional regulator [Dysgonamonadaceae bacterium]
MEKVIDIVIAESSDLLFEGLSTILYNSENDYFITRLFSFEDIEKTLLKKKINLLIVNPLFIYNNIKDVKKIRKQYPHLLIAYINMYALDNNTGALYDFALNIFENRSQLISTITKQLDQKQITNGNSDEDDPLSERETEVLLQIIKGYTNKEIAEILCISVHTVISHRKNIIIKTGIRSQSGLALYAVSKSLISLDDFDL